MKVYTGQKVIYKFKSEIMCHIKLYRWSKLRNIPLYKAIFKMRRNEVTECGLNQVWIKQELQEIRKF